MLLGYSLEPRPNGRALVIEGSVTTIGIYSRTSTNGHLSTTAIFFFLANSPYIDSCLNLSTTVHLSTMATFSCPQDGRFREIQLYM